MPAKGNSIVGITQTKFAAVPFVWLWHFSDMTHALTNVCNRGKSGSGADLPSCRSLDPLRTQAGAKSRSAASP
jgi:hypothetical protein